MALDIHNGLDAGAVHLDLSFDCFFGSKLMSDRERNIAKGKFLFDVSEGILVAMEDMEITRAELARRLGKQPPQITKLLFGAANMTLGTLSDIAFELGLKLGKPFIWERTDE